MEIKSITDIPLGKVLELKIPAGDVDLKVKILEKMVKDSEKTPIVFRTASILVKGLTSDVDAVQKIYNFVQSKVRYRTDKPYSEIFTAPYRMLRDIQMLGYASGDCDEIATLSASLLKSIGYKVRFVITNTTTAKTEQFNHIFTQVWIPSMRRWVNFDPTKRDRELGETSPFKRIKVYGILT
jgi:transglutaminase-like putative cysteine protease